MIEDGIVSPPCPDYETCERCHGDGWIYPVVNADGDEIDVTREQWEAAPEEDEALPDGWTWPAGFEGYCKGDPYTCPDCDGQGEVEVRNDPPEFDYDAWREERAAREYDEQRQRADV